MSSFLQFEHVSAGYGASTVLDDISFSLNEGESLALLGRNGVGKTTLLVTLMGLTRVHKGSIRWAGRDITRVPSHERALSGLGWVPQERLIFPSLTVEENLTVIGAKGPWTVKSVYEIFPRLAERSQNMGNQLSGGEQQMLAIGRALMTNPRLLLLDEPMEGLAPVIVQELGRTIRKLTDGGLAVVVVEQHAKLVLSLTQTAMALDRGKVVFTGSSDSLLAAPEQLDRFLAVA